MEIIRSQLINRETPLASAADILNQSLDQGDFRGSLADCHVPGMDSIILADNRLVNGGMARIFVTRNGQHDLGHLINPRSGDFVLGVHNHRFPITIVPLVGTFINYEVALDPEGPETLHQYAFNSGITGTMGVEHSGIVRTRPAVLNEQQPGGYVHMDAAELHTVVIPDQDTRAGVSAWLVMEEPEERTANIYSPTNHLTVSPDGLYNPFTTDQARDMVSRLVAEIS